MEKEAEKLYQEGHKQASVKLLAQKLQKDMQHLDWFLQLSGYLSAGGDLPQAEALLLQARELFPQSEEISYNLAVIYFQAGKFSQAHQFLQQVKQPQLQSDAYYLLAQEKRQEDKLPQALVYALTAIDYNPQLADNYLLAGDLLLRQHDLKTAQNYYQKAVDLQGKAANYFKLALVELALDQPQYRAHFEKARQLDQVYFEKHQTQVAEIERYLKSQSRDAK
ncbi:tetratricopeptide repeat protein [Lactobacillus sp. DCY120]|uniref:Tetratricopeptide repeat protein n=1 Tax=Bombilactobacillus apium TaxID=2675299 RepID=A0A850RA43_9LACO|nr:tetratricopeptide repeat protein [Bombilactobacillus apium]NVY95698.1 tetratricopeptide repeat protein [Bombilactobacillus apium]